MGDGWVTSVHTGWLVGKQARAGPLGAAVYMSARQAGAAVLCPRSHALQQPTPALQAPTWVLGHRRHLALHPHHAQVVLRRRQRPRLRVGPQPHTGVQQHWRAVAVQHAAAARAGGRAWRGGVGGVAGGGGAAGGQAGQWQGRAAATANACPPPASRARPGLERRVISLLLAHLPLKQPSASSVPGVGTSAGGRCCQCTRSEDTAWPHTCSSRGLGGWHAVCAGEGSAAWLARQAGGWPAPERPRLLQGSPWAPLQARPLLAPAPRPCWPPCTPPSHARCQKPTRRRWAGADRTYGTARGRTPGLRYRTRAVPDTGGTEAGPHEDQNAEPARGSAAVQELQRPARMAWQRCACAAAASGCPCWALPPHARAHGPPSCPAAMAAHHWGRSSIPGVGARGSAAGLHP